MGQETARTAYSDFSDLWKYNVQKIEQIGHAVERSIHDLEFDYAGFETKYADIMRQLDVLSSIYSGYNTLGGAEYVMRLKAVLAGYAASYTREGLDFNLVHYLLAKITDARNAGFEDFPAMAHHGPLPGAPRGVKARGDIASATHRWISFRRGRTWFIARFSSLRICADRSWRVISAEEPDVLNVEISGTIARVKDLFMKTPESPAMPRLILLLDRGRANYAADETGKRIYAMNDFITPRIVPFRSIREHPLSPGRVRLFGKNHIVLH